MLRRCAGPKLLEPPQTQLTPSVLPRASTSSTVSQAGCALRYSARLVRRHRPRGFAASCQRL